MFWKNSDAGKDWAQAEKAMTEDEMVGWHHWINGLSLSKLQETVKDEEAWRATVHRIAESDVTWLLNSSKWLPVALTTNLTTTLMHLPVPLVSSCTSLPLLTILLPHCPVPQHVKLSVLCDLCICSLFFRELVPLSALPGWSLLSKQVSTQKPALRELPSAC